MGPISIYLSVMRNIWLPLLSILDLSDCLQRCLIVYAGESCLYLYLLFTKVDPAAQKVEAELNASLEKRVG